MSIIGTGIYCKTSKENMSKISRCQHVTILIFSSLVFINPSLFYIQFSSIMHLCFSSLFQINSCLSDKKNLKNIPSTFFLSVFLLCTALLSLIYLKKRSKSYSYCVRCHFQVCQWLIFNQIQMIFIVLFY
jgi:hypothetical protein